VARRSASGRRPGRGLDLRAGPGARSPEPKVAARPPPRRTSEFDDRAPVPDQAGLRARRGRVTAGRVLVDRLWPRGLDQGIARHIDRVAQGRRAQPGRCANGSATIRRAGSSSGSGYTRGVPREPRRQAVARMERLAEGGPVTLIYSALATRSTTRPCVLAEYLRSNIGERAMISPCWLARSATCWARRVPVVLAGMGGRVPVRSWSRRWRRAGGFGFLGMVREAPAADCSPRSGRCARQGCHAVLASTSSRRRPVSDLLEAAGRGPVIALEVPVVSARSGTSIRGTGRPAAGGGR
jgi:uncharacterized protein YeaO (DUF488 family)